MPGTRLHSLTIRKLGRVQNSLQTLRLEGLDSGKVVRGREVACRHFTQESSHTFPLLQLGHCLEQNLLLHQLVSSACSGQELQQCQSWQDQGQQELCQDLL